MKATHIIFYYEWQAHTYSIGLLILEWLSKKSTSRLYVSWNIRPQSGSYIYLDLLKIGKK